MFIQNSWLKFLYWQYRGALKYSYPYKFFDKGVIIWLIGFFLFDSSSNLRYKHWMVDVKLIQFTSQQQEQVSNQVAP